MPVKARAGGQGRVRGGRPGAQQGSGSTPSPPAPDPSLATSVGSNISSAVGAWTAAGSLSAETTQFFDRLIAVPSSSRQTAYATLIDALVSAGIWAKLDALFIYAAELSSTSLVNLIQDPHLGFLDVTQGTPTFTVDSGWSVCGAAGLFDVNSNFNPSTAGGNYTQNDAMICAWHNGTTQENHLFLADTASDAKVELFPKWSDGNTYWSVNGTEITSTAPTTPGGFWLMQRTGASACEIHKNDTSIATSSNASTSLTNQTILANPNANAISCLGIGASLSSGQQTSLYNALRSYMTTVGVP